MGHTRNYIWRVEEGETTSGSGFKPADILCEHYGDKGMRTRVIDKEDLGGFPPWEMCALLNRVYEEGRKDAMSDLRRMLGVKE